MANGHRGVQAIPAQRALVRRGATVLRAKRTVEEVLEGGTAFIELPAVESREALFQDLLAAGIRAAATDLPEAIDVRAIRNGLGLTQEQFALRFGLELAALRNWEQGRTRIDTAAARYLRVIERHPDLVAETIAAG